MNQQTVQDSRSVKNTDFFQREQLLNTKLLPLTKTILTITILTITILFPLVCFSNLVRNSSFEHDTKDWKAYWNGFTIDSSTAHKGEKSLLLDFTNLARPKKYSGAYQTIHLNQKTVAPITISLWGKVENVVRKFKSYGDKGSWCRLRINAVTTDNKAIWNRDAKRQSMQFYFEGTSDWKYKERTFVFDKPIKTLNIYIQANACSGKAWFDDIYVRTAEVLKGEDVKTAYQACKLKKDGAAISLENQFIKITVDKNRGGRITSFNDKLSNKNFTADNAVGGIMKDVIMEAGFSTYFNQFYLSEITSNSPEKLSITLTGESEKMQYFKIQKIYTITRNSNVLLIDYKLINTKEAMTARCFTLRHHNALKIKGEKNNYYYPTSKGVKKMAEGTGMQAWHKDIVGGWSAFIAPKSQLGLVYTVDYSPLNFFYNWFGEQTNLECFFKTVKIKHGESWKTQISMMPIHKFKNIDAVKSGIAVAFEDLDKKATEFKLAIASGRQSKVNIEIKAKNFKTGQSFLIKRFQASLLPDKTHKFNISRTKLQNGNFLLVCTVYNSKNKKIIEAKRPLAANSDKFKYVFKPEKKKIPTILGTKPIQLTKEFITPHIKWAKPLAKGKIKVLGIVHSSSARDLVELAQRLDIDYTSVIFCGYFSPPEYYMSYNTTDSNNWLREKLKQEYDVILIGGINGTCFNKQNEKIILDKVKNGCSLVYVYPNCISKDMRKLLPLKPPVATGYAVSGKWQKTAPHYISSGIPFDAMPFKYGFRYTAKNPILTCGSYPLVAVKELSKSKVAVLGYPVACTDSINRKWFRYGGLIPTALNSNFTKKPDLLYPYWEYYYALLAKTVIWAAGKTSEDRIEQINFKSKTCTIAIKSTTNVVKNLVWELKDNTFKTVDRGNINLSFEQKIIEIPLKEMLGDKFLHVRLYQNNKVLDFAAKKISSKQPSVISNIRSDVLLNKDGTVKLKANICVSGSGVLKVELIDSFERLVAQKDIRVSKSGDISFELEFQNPLSRAYCLKTQIIHQGIVGNCFTKWVYLRTGRKRFNDYTTIMWLCDSTYLQNSEYLRNLQYKRIGQNQITSIQVHNTRWSKIPTHLSQVSKFLWRHNFETALNNLAPTHIGSKIFQKTKKKYADTKSVKYLCRNPCLNDPQYIKSVKDRIKKMVSAMKPYEPLFYCFGDENSLTLWSQKFDFCFSKHTLEQLREWLKKKYGSINRLNDIYGTTYKSFSEVTPLNSEQAQKNKEYSSWLDHRCFMEKTMAGFYAMAKAEVSKYDAGCPVGLSGTQNSTTYNGCNWSLLMNVFKDQNMAPYKGIQEELMRSFSSSDFRALPPAGGYDNTGGKVYYWIWRNAFVYKGAGVTFFIDDIALNPDFTLSRQLEDMTNATEDLRNGIGKILIKSQRLYDGIGLLYSSQSLKIASITNQITIYNNSVKGWNDLLNAGGYQYRFVAAEQLGKLKESGIKVLILPFNLVISAKEIKQLNEFVENGGTVIADAATGLFDGYGRKATGNNIQSLFGIRRESGSPSIGNFNMNAFSMPVTLYNDSIRAQKAQALATVTAKPAFFLNKHGKGKTIYLNFLMDKYPNLKISPAENNKYLSLLNTVLKICGTKRNLASVTQTAEAPAQQYRTFNFKLGKTKYIALLRHREAKCRDNKLKVSLYKQYHVYDMRNRKYLGAKKEFYLSLPAGEAAIFALEPGKIENILITIDKHSVAKSCEINYFVDMKAGQNTVSDRVVRIEVYSPAGCLMNHYSKNIFSKTGKIAGAFKTALNDVAGEWKIKAIDVASGISATTSFQLK